MRQICSTEHPQGIAAILKKPGWSWEELLAAGAGCWFCLIVLPIQVIWGAYCAAAGLSECEGVLLSQGCVDPFSPKVVRASMGAILNVPIFPDVSELQLECLQEVRLQSSWLPI